MEEPFHPVLSQRQPGVNKIRIAATFTQRWEPAPVPARLRVWFRRPRWWFPVLVFNLVVPDSGGYPDRWFVLGAWRGFPCARGVEGVWLGGGPGPGGLVAPGLRPIRGYAERGVGVRPRNAVVHEVNPPRPEALKRFVPRAIPVSVRDQENIVAHEQAAPPTRTGSLPSQYARMTRRVVQEGSGAGSGDLQPQAGCPCARS